MFAHRLLLLTEAFPPSVGGIQAYLSGLLNELPPDQSFAMAAAEPGDAAWDAQQRYRVTRVATRAWTYPRWRPAWQAVREIVRREKIEAVVCGKALFEGRAASRIQSEYGIPFVVCTYAMEIPMWLKHRKTRRDLLNVLGHAGRVIVINEETKHLLQELNVPEKKLVKIYPGVHEEFFSTPSGVEEFRIKHGLAGKRVIVSVARLVPRKGMDMLLESFARVLRSVPAAHLLVVGDGPERARLMALVRAGGLQSAVTFLGPVSSHDVRRAMACAEVFALTPRALPEDPEGFGVVYLEAAAMGKTSVGSKAGGVPEAVLDGVTGLLVSPEDVDAAARVLTRVLNDESIRRRLADAARERARKEFHWAGRALLFQGMIHAMLTERTVHS